MTHTNMFSKAVLDYLLEPRASIDLLDNNDSEIYYHNSGQICSIVNSLWTDQVSFKVTRSNI